MKKLIAVLASIFFMAPLVNAQEVDYTPSISLESKFGYNRQLQKDGLGGFGCDGFYFNLDGYISENFSYSLNQGLTSVGDVGLLDATNWLTLTYEYENFSFTAGKDAIFIGSFEYDANDLDNYFDLCSYFYNYFSAWQWGAYADWTNDAETSTFAFQVASSPLASYGPEDNLFAYALAWRGYLDWYESYWTLNLMEFEKGSYVKGLAMGNNFYIGNFTMGVDFMLRGHSSDDFLNDYTLIFAPSYTINDSFRLFAKCGFEMSASTLPYDFTGEYLSNDDRILANSENPYALPAYLTGFEPNDPYIFYGAGIEYFPLGLDGDVRFHAVWSANNLTNIHSLNIGVKCRFDITKSIQSLLK